ncbi:group 1 glycosyl transferase [Pandoraea sp. SD6-2]|nr:group 1 glycosyl transferase [Pandoraea sp. SD6-2]
MFPFKHHWPIVRFFNQSLLGWSIARFARKQELVDPVIWTYHPFMLDSVGHLQHGPLVYHCVDDLAAVPGTDAAMLNGAEQELLRECAVVFTTTIRLLERCLPFNANTHYFGNVADVAHFRQALTSGRLPADLEVIPCPRLVYHGVLSDFKLDFSLILAAVNKAPAWQWIFIGEEREGQRNEVISQLRAYPNVHFIGYRSYEDLPLYLRGMSVGLLPTSLNTYTQAMFPMKFFEYLAAGLPVVSTPLDFIRGGFDGLEVGGTPDEFVAAIARQLHRGRLTADESSDYVGDNTWDARIAKMLDCIRPLLAGFDQPDGSPGTSKGIGNE